MFPNFVGILFSGIALLFGPAGPGFKNSAGVIQARNNADAAFAKLQIGAPTVGDDATTKTYVDALVGGFIAIPVTAAAGNFDSTATIPNGSVITRVSTDVITLYDGGATISVGYVGATSAYQATTENVPIFVNEYTTQRTRQQNSGSAKAVRVTLGGAPTVGASVVYVWYGTPLT